MRHTRLTVLAALGLSATLASQCPDYSSGVASAGIGSVTGGTYVPMIYIDCLPRIATIEVQFGRPGGTSTINGDPLTLAIWDDPTDDQNPNDAVLVATIPIAAGVTGGHTGQWQAYDLASLRGSAIPCTGGMFVGVAVSYAAASGHNPAAIDFTRFDIGRMWMGGRYPSLPGAYDFANITANSFLTPVQNQGFPPGNWLIRATPFERTAHACGSTQIRQIGTGMIGSSLTTRLENVVGTPVIGYGITATGIPFCGCTVAHEYSIVIVGANATLPIPNNPFLIGLPLISQGVDFGASGGCPSPTFTATDSFSFQIQ